MSNEEIENKLDEQNVETAEDSGNTVPAADTEDVVTEDRVSEKSGNSDNSENTEIKKVKKASTAKSAMPAEKKRKLFKLIYYPVLALFVMLMFVFSALDGAVGYYPSAYGDGYYKAVGSHIKELSETSRSSISSTVDNGALSDARAYILGVLEAGGFARVEEVKTEKDDNAEENELITTITGYKKDGDVKKPTVTLQTSTLDGDLQDTLGLPEMIAGLNVTNIVAAVPSGKANAGAVVITVRYDTRTDTKGAASNGAFVANAVQSLIEFAKSGKSYKNDIVVVFTEDLDMSYGAYAFFNLFKGFDDVTSRAKAGISLDAYGNSGTLALTDMSGADLDYLNAYASVSGNVFNSSVVTDSLPDGLINIHAVKAFGKIPAVQVAVLGGLDKGQSSLDTADNVSDSVIKQQARLIKDYVEKFADSTDSYGAVGTDGTAVFSYLDGGTVAYTPVAAYVVGALILAMLAAVVIALILKKTFSLKNMLIAAGVQLAVVASTLVALLAAYFLVTLMLTGFGVLPIQSLLQLRYMNAGIMIAAVVISIASAFGFTTLYKRLFKVTSSDVVRGTAVLFGIAGAVMSFACPAYSFMTGWIGLLMLAVSLVTVCLHKTFKAKFGFGMDRLYLYAIPVALCLPLIMAEVVMVSSLLPLVLLPVLMTVFTAMTGVAVPYLDRTQPMLDKLVKKLPDRTIRVEHMVTEKVEDRAKKGKFTEKTYKRVDKEKVPYNYKNYFGISVVAVIGIVIALFSGGFGVDYNKTLTGFHSYNDAVYNDSLIYEIEKDSAGTSQRIVVGDLMTYKFISRNISDLTWDAAGNRYTKNVNYNVGEIIYRDPSVSKSDKTYTVTTFDGAHSNVTIKIPSARSITKITLKEVNKNFGEDYEGYVYEFNNRDEIVLRLPYGFDTMFTLDVEGGSISRIEYEEYRMLSETDTLLDIVDEWNSVKDNADLNGLRAGIVIKSTLSV